MSDFSVMSRPSLRVDYDRQSAAEFDQRGVVSDDRVANLTGLIRRLLDSHQRGATGRILDIGCGTGRFTIPFAKHFRDYTVVGADKSANMVEQAQEKHGAGQVRWEVQDICRQTFDSRTFDFVFLSDLLHHLPDPLEAIRECKRVLRPGGWLLCKYGAMENIAQDPEHYFFPETVEIDAKRTPTEAHVVNWLGTEEFGSVESQTHHERTRPDGAARLAAAKAKSISVLHMLEPHQFEAGIDRLAAHVARNPEDLWLQKDSSTWTWGQR